MTHIPISRELLRFKIYGMIKILIPLVFLTSVKCLSQNKENDSTSISKTEKVGFAIIDEVPVFPGCEGLSQKETRGCFQQKMLEHLKVNFRYPKKAVKKKISGRVSILFTISQNGTVENIKTRGPHPLLEKEAVRIISLLPKMIPGKQQGRPVKVPFSIPLTFSL